MSDRYEDEFDALNRTISNSRRGFKECASFLRPDLKPESAYAWLKACTSLHGDQRLKFQQIIALCHFCDQFDALYYMADELGHRRPEPRPEGAERAEVARKVVDAAMRLEEQLQRAEALGIVIPLTRKR